MPGDFLHSQKHAIHPVRTALILLRVRLVAYAQFARGFPRPFIVAKEDHLDVRVQQHPALQRIALDDAAVASKGLPRREERQHFLVTCTSRAALDGTSEGYRMKNSLHTLQRMNPSTPVPGG